MIINGEDARKKLKTGLDALANAVKKTLGAKGRNVILARGYTIPHITNDGVSVAKEVKLECPIENIGANLVKSVASKTDDNVGDGTSTSVVLAQALVSEGYKVTDKNTNLLSLKKGIEMATQEAVKILKKLSTKVESHKVLKQVAIISANGDEETGNFVADVIKTVGKEGIVKVEDSEHGFTSTEYKEGINFEQGYLSTYFITDHFKMEAALDNPLILVYNGYIDNIHDLVPAMTLAVDSGKSLLVIAEDIEVQTLNTLAANKIEGHIKVCAVKAPEYGERRKEILKDIAISTGAKYLAKDQGDNLKEIFLEDLGGSESASIGKEATVITNGYGDELQIKERVEVLKNQIENSQEGREKEVLKERLAKLSTGIAIIKVGGHSDIERMEKKDRIQDAIQATRAALEEGFVAGGGVTLLEVSRLLKDLKSSNKDEQKGIDVVIKSLCAPFIQICDNAGMVHVKPSGFFNKLSWASFLTTPERENNAEDLIYSIREFKYGAGINVKTEKYENLFDSGIIDPTKVERVALENAASIAGILLTTETVVFNDEQFI